MNLATPWTPIVLLALLAALVHLLQGRLAGWRIAALAGAGLAAVAASLALLRLSPDTAPLAFPWEPALGGSPHWAADPEMFPFAAALLLLLAGIVLADNVSANRWPVAFLLTGAALGILFAENLLALALAWLLMEVLLHLVTVDSSQKSPRQDAHTLDALWGFLGLAGILFLWHATAGASLRPYETSQWTAQARTILAAVAIVRIGAYPLVSRRLAFGSARLSPVDACAAAPLVAGLALAQRAALLGLLPNAGWLVWLGAGSALFCGFAAWQSASVHDRAQWALRAALGLVLLLWGADIAPPLLLFPSAAASIALGLGLWTLRPSAQSSADPFSRRALHVAASLAPVIVMGLGPLSPATFGMLRLWQRLLDQSLFLPMLLALAGQMLAMAALLRPDSEPERARGGVARWGAYGIWLALAVAAALWPRMFLTLGGDESGKIAAALDLPQSLGAWAALALPLLGALALPEPSRIAPSGRAWAERTAGVLSLGWLGAAGLAAAHWIGRAIRGLDRMLGSDGYLPWAMALLLGLVLLIAAR